ncbi:hypothetical protein CEXT_209421 [Caerostris extrusa]|uniref:Uncharacterized protein n=1 Tax=Caerostris extrusa TaxID=172846 RepID=A0AAV4PJ67_CAEEX|nr:hypothetical protein CEXT_209421 [Caerostris extrusa]
MFGPPLRKILGARSHERHLPGQVTMWSNNLLAVTKTTTFHTSISYGQVPFLFDWLARILKTLHGFDEKAVNWTLYS